MAVSSKLANLITRASRRGSRTKQLEDRSRVIDVEAREVKPKPKLEDNTIRADKKDTSKKPGRGRAGRAAAIAAGAAAAGLGVAAMTVKENKTQPAAPSSVGASSKTESIQDLKKRVENKSAAPAKASTPAQPKSSPAKTTTAKKGLSDFEKKFKEMRAAGKESFTYNGKKITTRYKEESDAQHKANVAKIKNKNEAAYEKKMKEVSGFNRGGTPAKKPVARKSTGRK